jgi:hypothetical protein
MGRLSTDRNTWAALTCLGLVWLPGCQAPGSLGEGLHPEPVQETVALLRRVGDCAEKRFWADRNECQTRLIYSERACADAFSELGRTYYYGKGYDAYPLYRLLNACASAYCKRLPTPRPRLCAVLPVGPSPASWFDRVEPFMLAIDALEGVWASKTTLLLGPNHGYCRILRTPARSAPEVTLWLRRQGARLHVRATGGVDGSWSFDRLSGEAARPIINALYERKYRGAIWIRLENVVPLSAFVDLDVALQAAGWCQVQSPEAKHDGPGGLSCPPGGNRPVREFLPLLDGGVLGTAASVRVTPTGLYYKGKFVVKIEGGRVPGNFITDGPQGYLIHPLRKAILADHPKPGIPSSVRIVVAPGMTLSSYLAYSISYSGTQALAQATRNDRTMPQSLHCQ